MANTQQLSLALTKLDERIRPGGRVDLVSELRIELLREVFQEGVGQLLVEVPVAQRQETSVLLDDVAENGIIRIIER